MRPTNDNWICSVYATRNYTQPNGNHQQMLELKLTKSFENEWSSTMKVSSAKPSDECSVLTSTWTLNGFASYFKVEHKTRHDTGHWAICLLFSLTATARKKKWIQISKEKTNRCTLRLSVSLWMLFSVNIVCGNYWTRCHNGIWCRSAVSVEHRERERERETHTKKNATSISAVYVLWMCIEVWYDDWCAL